MKKFIYYIISILTLSACTDTLEPDFDGGPSGEPAEITVNLALGEVGAISRADIAEGLDRRITSIWVATFNASTGARTGVYKSTGLNQSMTPHSTTQRVSFKTQSGSSYIVAVANFDHRFGSNSDDGELVSLSEALDAATTWERFRILSCAFDQAGMVSTDAPLNALVMSGSYVSRSHSDGSRPALETVSIRSGSNTLSGSIHLRRTISQITFNITPNTSNIKSMEVVSWRVCHLPAAAWVFERADEDDNINCLDVRDAAGHKYHTSDWSNDIEDVTGGFKFDFWQLENRRQGLEVPAEYSANPYLYRDKEFKTAEGRNTRKFISLLTSEDDPSPDNYATYVEFTVRMDMLKDENGGELNVTRKAEMTYRVHLGYCEGGNNAEKARDFRVRRNTKYTYNVKINNVNDLIVEASGEEINPAVEGSVSDISKTFKQLDAHYSAMNVELTASDLSDFQYHILCYDENGGEVRIISDDPSTIPAPGSKNYKYLTWIELRKTTGENVIAAYQPRSKNNVNNVKTLLLSDLGPDDEAGWYTMFINEYVYEESSDESTSLGWHTYINKPDRKAWLNVVGHMSSDKQSIHHESKYAISQSSIQTYYTNASQTAIGVEHVNESLGLNLRNTFNTVANANGNKVGTNDQSGRFNLAQFLNGETGEHTLSWKDNNIEWSSVIEAGAYQYINTINNQNISIAAHYEPLPKIKTVASTVEDNISPYYKTGKDGYDMRPYDPDQTSNAQYIQAITACMNRNRDLDGDGKIDANELRWVVPSSRQCIRMVLGRNALVTPLFDPTEVKQLPEGGISNNSLSTSLMMYAGDGKMVWLMEGTSTSLWRQWENTCAAPWQVRCVRTLGHNLNELSEDQSQDRAFFRRVGTNIIDLSAYNPRALRAKVDGALPVHHTNDQNNNRCYKAFEFSENMYSLSNSNIGLSGKTIEWSSYLASNNPCDYLNTNGQTGWRVPNQKELTILGLLGILGSGTTYQLTCTYSYYNDAGYGYRVQDPTETISSATRIPMMIVTDNGNGTQPTENRLNNATITSSTNTWGIRCVRDCE